jgi:hypothetical protein
MEQTVEQAIENIDRRKREIREQYGFCYDDDLGPLNSFGTDEDNTDTVPAPSVVDLL